jgi:hypothetical protein
MTSDIMASDIADEPSGDPTYAFKASLIGSLCQFTLKPDALEWQIGRRSGRIRYDAVSAVRLSYRPVTMQSHRFIAEIWSPGNPKIQIVSVSWRSIMEQQRLDAAYAAFIIELHRRLAAAGAPARFSTGLPFATYWVGVDIWRCPGRDRRLAGARDDLINGRRWWWSRYFSGVRLSARHVFLSQQAGPLPPRRCSGGCVAENLVCRRRQPPRRAEMVQPAATRGWTPYQCRTAKPMSTRAEVGISRPMLASLDVA